MSKISTYQKLKAENIKLKQQLSTLATTPDSTEGILIKAEWVMITETEAALWMGNHLVPNVFIGLLNRVIGG